MQKPYEAPTLTFIGEAEDLVLGIPSMGTDNQGIAASDFEFEQD